MADFGKLNFSVAFNPTSAFPLDARCYFNSLALAKAAAATAEEVGSTNTVYHYGMMLLVDDGTTAKWYMIQRDRTLLDPTTINNSNSGGGTNFTTDNTLTFGEDGVLRVNTTNDMAADNTLPITSAGVFTQVGNIEVLLNTI